MIENEKINNKDIFIENGKRQICPNCGETFVFENKHERLFRNTVLMYEDKETKIMTLKCKSCKFLFDYDTKESIEPIDENKKIG